MTARGVFKLVGRLAHALRLVRCYRSRRLNNRRMRVLPAIENFVSIAFHTLGLFHILLAACTGSLLGLGAFCGAAGERSCERCRALWTVHYYHNWTLDCLVLGSLHWYL
jgi:hypothetical protein